MNLVPVMTVPYASCVDDALAALAAAGLTPSPDLPLVDALSAVFRASWFSGDLEVPEPPPVVGSADYAVLPYTVTAGPGFPLAWPAALVWRERGGYRVRKFFPSAPVEARYVRGSRARFASLVEALAWANEV